MGKPQTGNLSGIKGKSAQRPECLAKLAAKQSQSFPQQQNIGIVRYIAAGSAQMDDGPGQGALISPGQNVGHNIMAHLLFIGGNGFIVDILQMA